MSSWGRPTAETGSGWAVVDVETSGLKPGPARILSIAVLALDADGHTEHSFASLLNPGTDPGPTHVHGLTAEMLHGQPQFSEIVDDLTAALQGRTLVAHNVAFDYGFLAAEAELAGAELPIDTVMCTVELARHLDLGLANLRLETLAAHWGITQTRPHDALDDAQVLAGVLVRALKRAKERDVWLPVRPVTRRLWPNGRITHDELRPLKAQASRMPVVDPQTSLVICNEPSPEQGKGYLARELGVPTVSDAQFMAGVAAVAGGTGIEEFAAGEQISLF